MLKRHIIAVALGCFLSLPLFASADVDYRLSCTQPGKDILRDLAEGSKASLRSWYRVVVKLPQYCRVLNLEKFGTPMAGKIELRFSSSSVSSDSETLVTAEILHVSSKTVVKTLNYTIPHTVAKSIPLQVDAFWQYDGEKLLPFSSIEQQTFVREAVSSPGGLAELRKTMRFDTTRIHSRIDESMDRAHYCQSGLENLDERLLPFTLRLQGEAQRKICDGLAGHGGRICTIRQLSWEFSDPFNDFSCYSCTTRKSGVQICFGRPNTLTTECEDGFYAPPSVPNLTHQKWQNDDGDDLFVSNNEGEIIYFTKELSVKSQLEEFMMVPCLNGLYFDTEKVSAHDLSILLETLKSCSDRVHYLQLDGFSPEQAKKILALMTDMPKLHTLVVSDIDLHHFVNQEFSSTLAERNITLSKLECDEGT